MKSPAKTPTKSAPMPTISKRNKEMVRVYATNPKLTKTDAYMATHKVNPNTKITSLHQQAAHTFRNPLVKAELDKYSNLFEDTIVGTVTDWQQSENTRKREIATTTAMWGHDKIHGKATQRIEQHTTGVTLHIDLSSALTDE